MGLCLSSFFVVLAVVLVRVANSDRLLNELREARNADVATRKIAVAPVDIAMPEKVHPVVQQADDVPSKDSFSRPAEDATA